MHSRVYFIYSSSQFVHVHFRHGIPRSDIGGWIDEQKCKNHHRHHVEQYDGEDFMCVQASSGARTIANN
jgi:hypothetical protein